MEIIKSILVAIICIIITSLLVGIPIVLFHLYLEAVSNYGTGGAMPR